MSNLNPDKGHANGSCNRTACQAPLAHEPEHQFMRDYMTANGRLHYCAKCARDFDHWDRIDSPGQPPRITRETKTEGAA